MWETIETSTSECGQSTEITQRARVPGGWLVRTVVAGRSPGLSGLQVVPAVALVFVPDGCRRWSVDGVVDE